LDRNLGATAVTGTARSVFNNDEDYIAAESASFGDLFQWGRGADGHQVRNPLSGTINTQSTMDSPGHDDFIIVDQSPFDWRTPHNDNLWQGVNGINNPCPSGYQLPTEEELNAELTSWGPNFNAAGAFASPLKLPMSGGRSGSPGSLYAVGSAGRYWSRTVTTGGNSRLLLFTSSNALVITSLRTNGDSVRCIKE
jgi:hypothetical protein